MNCHVIRREEPVPPPRAALAQTFAWRAQCRRCGMIVMAAWAAGLAVQADAELLTLEGEIRAMAKGLPIFEVLEFSTGSELVFRDLEMVRRGRTRPVVAGHECPGGRKAPQRRNARKKKPGPAVPAGPPPF